MLALLALLVVNVLSAATSEGLVAETFRFVARSGAGWLLFLAVVDSVANGASAKRLIACLLAGAALSASIGLLALALGPEAPELLAQVIRVGGVTRLHGSFNYPNTAAMYWSATAICGTGLIFLAGSSARRVAIALVVSALAAITLLTLSRGAALGFGGGMATVAVVLLVLRRRRAAVLALGGAAAFVAGTIGVQLLLLPDAHLFEEGQAPLYRATYEAPETIQAAPGETVTVPVVVTNTGQVTWNEPPETAFSLGADWLDPTMTAATGPAPVIAVVPESVEPGESVAIEAEITVPDEAGAHVAGWNMATDSEVRFSYFGVPVLTTVVLVGGAVAPDGPGLNRTVQLEEASLEPPTRTQLWRAAVQMIGEKPLLGVGPGTFRLRHGPYLGLSFTDERIHSNNFVLELASTTGLLGLAAFATLVGYVLLRIIRTLRRTIVLVFILGALSAFFWAGLVDYFLGFMGTAGLFWTLLGLGLGLAIKARVVGKADVVGVEPST